MIELINIYKAYGEKVLFNNFNLKILDGEFVVFSGPSGCGKTTLLNMIGGLEEVDRGKIIINGVDITNKKTHFQYFREVVGFVFQNFALIEDKTVFENLKLVKKKNQSGISVDESLRRVGLFEKKNSKVYTLSGGEQQRIALARLMIKKCNLILADEPTGSLDRNNAEIVLSILDELNQEGKTVILVSHDETIKKKGEKVIEL